MRVLVAVLALLGAGAAPSQAQRSSLGLHLPKETLAFYLLGKDTAMGLEVDMSLSKSAADASATSTYRRRGALGVVWQRAWATGHEVAPFGFVRATGAFAAQSTSGAGEIRELSGELSVGAGVSWRPWERVALWVRQPVALSRDWLEDDSRTEESKTLNVNTLRFHLRPPEVLAVFMW